MRRRLALMVAVNGLWLVASGAGAQDLLTNGGLELVFPDVGGFESVPPGWEIEEGPRVPFLPPPYIGDYNESGVPAVPCPAGLHCGAVDAADYTVWRDKFGTSATLPNRDPRLSGNVNKFDYTIWKQTFGDPYPLSLAEPGNFSHLILEGDWHMWFQPYYGTFANAEDNFIHMTQTVAGTPGLTYTMKGSALFEAYFAGARANLNLAGSDTSNPADGLPSPTDAFFALEFLDAGGTVLDLEEIELMAAGQLPNTIWKEHTLSAVAPAGTVEVRVRVSMIDGVSNPDANPQSFFVDQFSLTASGGAGSVVPEPASIGLCMLATIAASLWRRRTGRSH